jgi:5-oxopent-3-ene-1,2,5-tricarboxylate decarboxylase / 2-hydroxyhepta-2,4-diene-1,7-dioate isomerase
MTAQLPWLPRGTVYGTLMNHRSEHTALAAQMHAAPYKAPPNTPVLYIKTANTFSAYDTVITLPRQVPQVQVRATIGIVFGPPAQQNRAQEAIKSIASMVLMNDLTVPHESFYRPPVKFKCIDGFLGVGAQPHAWTDGAALERLQLQVQVRINHSLVHTVDLSLLVRPAAQLVADVAEFITLQEGDVLMLGCDFAAPLARAGDVIDISAEGFAPLRNTLVAAT